jgi:hypothetical protein
MAFLVSKKFADKHIPMNYCDNTEYKEFECSVCSSHYHIFYAFKRCSICGVFACPNCSLSIAINRSNINHFLGTPNKAILDGYILEGCIICLTKIEINNILQIPFNDLPLYINEEWVTPGAEEAYQARFSEETVKIAVGNKYIAVKCTNTPYFSI